MFVDGPTPPPHPFSPCIFFIMYTNSNQYSNRICLKRANSLIKKPPEYMACSGENLTHVCKKKIQQEKNNYNPTPPKHENSRRILYMY